MALRPGPDRVATELRRIALALCGLDLAGRVVPVAGRGVILCLHSVRRSEPHSFSPLRDLQFSPEALDRLLGALHRLGVVVLPLAAALAATGEDGPPFVCFTLDDGYRDNAENAWPIFRRWQAPFTIFLTSGFIDGDLPMPWSLLEGLIRRESVLELDDGERSHRWPTVSVLDQRRAYAGAETVFRRGGLAHRRALVDGVRRRYGEAVIADARRQALDWDLVRTMADDPLVDFGAHTVSHPMLGWLPVEEAAWEIGHARAVIEREIARPVPHFAFPFGDGAAIGPDGADLARAAGFSLAVSTRRARLERSVLPERFRLPRITLDGHYQGLRPSLGQITGRLGALKRMVRREGRG